MNGAFGENPPYQIKNSVKKFNTEWDRIIGSKSNVQNYRKSMINTMESFLNEIMKFQKENIETQKRKQRKSRNF